MMKIWRVAVKIIGIKRQTTGDIAFETVSQRKPRNYGETPTNFIKEESEKQRG